MMATIVTKQTLVLVIKLVEKIDSREFSVVFKNTKFHFSLLLNLKETLSRLLTVINDAEEKLFTDPHMKELLVMLRYDVYKAGKLLGNVRYNVYETLTSKVRKKLFILFHRIYSNKQKLIERLSLSNYVPFRNLTSSVVADESCIYGRDDDQKLLKGLLLSSDSDSKIRVISIVGMVGIGKTTLAKLLYNDPQVKDNFDLKVWAYISKHFDVLTVIKTILESIASQTISSDNMDSQPLESFIAKRNDTNDVKTIDQNLLLVTLLQILSTKKFLLVLDDVLDAKSVDWIYMMDIFNVGKMGSRIIITTRNEKVALSMQTFLFVHYMRPIGSEDCGFIIAAHSYVACNYNNIDFETIFAEKCDGSPLAAITLGRAFHRITLSQHYEQSFELECNILRLANYEVRNALESSYLHLSDPLQRCFAYCSIFPKKSILNKKMVVQLWIAEGLVELPTSQQSLEKVGEEYFDVLVSWSLIQRRSINDEEANFEMHNLIHDLATVLSSVLLERVHSLSYNRGLYDSFNKFDKVDGLKYQRTFLALPLQEQLPLCLLSNKVVHDLLPTMEQLRVLSLSNYKSIIEVPNSIGNLLYLRYLNLSRTKIERLPSETCKLHNLQFLLLSGCKRLTELPEDIGKLVNLRHLDVSDTALREMPVQIVKLESLQILSDFVVSKRNGGLKVAELGKFPHLHGKLSISQLQNVNDPFEAFQAGMKMKEQIDGLALEWDSGSSFSNSQIQSVVFEHLQPSTNLKSLTIKGYGGINFPNWLGNFLFGNMMYLRISNCDNCIWLPPLGQLGNLKELIIDSMLSIKSVGTEFYGSDSSPSFQPFPSLETLHFEDMPNLEKWNIIGGTAIKFPSLKSLLLIKCPKLIGNIPDKLPSLIEYDLREHDLQVESRHSYDNGKNITIIPLSDVLSQLMFPPNSLQKLTIDGFPSLTSFPRDGLPKTLKFLIISNCENLEFLPNEYLHNYSSLEELKISYSCNSMISFTLGALPILKSLFIEGCKNLKSILITEDASQKSLSFLRSIRIWDCNEFESFPPGGLATPNLVYIAMWKCEKLCSLPQAMNTLTDLQEMEIDNLPNLQSFVVDDLPISLQVLTIGSVGGIMWNTGPTWEHLNRLSMLRIKGSDTVNLLMVPLLPASLVTLCICGLNDTRIDRKWFASQSPVDVAN
ncbi:putative disease resistance RPP13-like protein 1 [Cicer arietinum]|uniref:Disease resistance RPP13-like protein 1 n=2 Tax=Cicer TaxID=3826 RepID=A0A3Q7XJ10_CICAR|nr:putative disease resistance RPP13-like protein 1 [Cicer arietinum]